MIDYDNLFEKMTMSCDNCPEEYTIEGIFSECFDVAKDDGWIIKKVNNEWLHFCCKECEVKYDFKDKRRI